MERIKKYLLINEAHELNALALEAKKRPVNIYIAGQMTGLEDYNYSSFISAAKELKRLGLHPVHTANLPRGRSWDEYLKLSLDLLKDCEAIILLKGYENSKGAMLELETARQLGIKEFVLKENLK